MSPRRHESLRKVSVGIKHRLTNRVHNLNLWATIDTVR